MLLALALVLQFWGSIWIRNWADRVAGSGSQVWINNILILVLAVYMNELLAATLSIFYLLLFCGVVVIFSVLAKRITPTPIEEGVN